MASSAAQVFDYDAYGNLLGSPSPQTDLLYAGEMIDPYLGWYYNRARWYDPATDPTASIFRRSMRLCLANESRCRLACPPSSPGDWCGVAEG